MREQLAQVGAEVQPVGTGAHDVAQARLVQRHLTAAERSDLVAVDVDAPHLVPQVGEAGSRHQADVPGADDAERLELLGHLPGTGRRPLATAITVSFEKSSPSVLSTHTTDEPILHLPRSLVNTAMRCSVPPVA